MANILPHIRKYWYWYLTGAIFLYLIFQGTKMIIANWPVAGSITSPFGNRIHPITGVETFHNGTDIGAATGTPIYSPWPGEVISQYYNSTGGNQMIILHDNGLTTGYAHLSDYSTIQGERVNAGQEIGLVGATGAVTGPHLHLTLKDTTGQYVDPANYFV